MRNLRVRSVGAVAAVAVVLGLAVGGAAVATQERANERVRIYTAALAAVEAEYVEPVSEVCSAPQVCGSETLIYGSIDGMLRTLDPHSSFFSPREFAQMRERQEGRYFGIGISIVRNPATGEIAVTQLFEGSPAYRAGIRRGDIIAGVGTEDADGWQTQDVVDRVKGPKGTTVDLRIKRPGLDTEIPLTVERDEIRIASVRTAFMIAPGTGYVRLQDFSETTNEELGAALGRLKVNGMTRLVLDLRENPGGPLDQAIAVSNRFLQRGEVIVSTRGRVRNSDEIYKATRQGDYTDLPLIVLVNRQSASASEIVAGAVQDHDRGVVVGETTFGKALVQSVYPISNGAGLALTTGRYYTPSGRMIQRPWDGSFDDYMLYTQRDQDAQRQHNPEDMKLTDGQRKVYSGGGIEPDHFVPGPIEGFNPSSFARMLRGRQAFVGFAERFTKEGDDRPGARSAATHRVAPGWAVTDAMVEEFREFLRAERVTIDDAAFAADLPFIKAMIHYEVDIDLFGVEEARRSISAVDPQLQAALGHFGEAQNMLEQAARRAAGRVPVAAAAR
jgi:carboxyl-terminal processing protease